MSNLGTCFALLPWGHVAQDGQCSSQGTKEKGIMQPDVITNRKLYRGLYCSCIKHEMLT